MEIANIKQQQRDYTGLAFKIESAHALMKNRIFVSHFMTQLGRSRPASMMIDSVEALDATAIVRGSITGSADDSTALVGAYLRALRADMEIGKHFDSILMTSFERARTGEVQNFEITFKFKPESSS